MSSKQKRQQSAVPQISFGVLWPAMLRAGFKTIRRGGWRLMGVFLATQALILVIGLPVIYWLFRQALYASGLRGLDLGAIEFQAGSLISLTLIAVILVLVLWAVSLQIAFLLLAVQRVRRAEPLSLKGLGADIRDIFKRLATVRAHGLFWYLFLVLPLAGFGFFSVLTQAVSIPSFITGELMKSVPGQVLYFAFILVVVLVNVRLALTVPIFALSRASGFLSMRLSFRMMRRTRFALELTGILTLVIAVVVAVLLPALSLIPTILSDEFAPHLSPIVASASLAVAQVSGVLFTSMLVVWFAGVLLELLSRRSDVVPSAVKLRDIEWVDDAPVATGARASFWVRHPAVRPLATLVVIASGLTALNLPVMHALDTKPDALVIAHRGWNDHGVENTISGLEAAHRAEADLVEMDVMQTADGKFVVMHDASLSRLADRPDEVKDLTLEELTAIEVHDLTGRSDLIPSLETYVTRANELEMPLLLELKPHGGETDDVVKLFADEMNRLGALESHIYHSLDKPMIEELKALHPGLMVGYTMAAAGVAAPHTTADFIVVEDFSVTEHLREDTHARGMGFFVWTVNDAVKMRQLFRDGVDGIITDDPDIAVSERLEMNEDPGLAEALFDALMRFVVIV